MSRCFNFYMDMRSNENKKLETLNLLLNHQFSGVVIFGRNFNMILSDWWIP